jgi:multidrug resistance protein MdtO
VEELVSTRPQAAPGRVAASQTISPPGTAPWFADFLRQELAPYPGRVSIVARMVIAVTLTMLVIMTFHLPAGALGGYYALVLSRESLRNTVQQTWLTSVFFGLGTLYVMVGVALFVDSPVTHFLWVIASFYLIFFVMGTARNYGLAAGFSFLIATAIPLWDRAGEVNHKIDLTLYTMLSVIIGALCTLVVELVYRSFHPADPVITGIADRLAVSGHLLESAAEGKLPRRQEQMRLMQYAMVGPSSLRRQLIRAGIAAESRARAAAAVSISGRIVELCAAGAAELAQGIRPSSADRIRLLALAANLQRQARAIHLLPDAAQIGTAVVPCWKGPETLSPDLRLLPEIERSVSALSDVVNSFGMPAPAPLSAPTGVEQTRRATRAIAKMLGSQPSTIFVADAFTNRDYLIFALRGCLAASLCYIIYNAIDWPGINTAVATCIITALGTIGSSRQKQVLRIAGAFVGGFIISLPAQVFLLPLMDSISAFTLFFASVSLLAAWFATSSPRLSYFGMQIALAFYLVNLQEPMVQISLSVARDRVVGVLLGLMAMWLVFDQFAAPLATDRMLQLLRSNLSLMADLALAAGKTRDSRRTVQEARAVVQKVRELRDRINDNFSQMNAQADAVPFEFGSKRTRQLRAREQMLAIQPSMRTVFLLEIALLRFDVEQTQAAGSQDEDLLVRTLLADSSNALKRLCALLPGQAGDSASRRNTQAECAHIIARARQKLAASMRTNHNAVPPFVPPGTGLCTSLLASLTSLERAIQATPLVL